MLVLERLIGLASPEAALRRAVRLSDQGKAAEAFPLLTRSAKAGIADAEYRVACCYLEGAGVPASRIEGARWLQRAAGHGHIEAQTLLGGLCVHGLAGDASGDRSERLFAEEEPGEPDFASALNPPRPAAEAGSAKAQAVLAYVLTCGPEEMRDLDEAHRWYRRSAAAGCPEGCLGYALSLAPRTSDEAGRHEVAENLRHAAEAELPTAIYLLAVLTEQGVGVARDATLAAEPYRHAAERGQRSAQLRWGLALMEGRDVEQDVVLGESWLRRAALAGDPDAAALVGILQFVSVTQQFNTTSSMGRLTLNVLLSFAQFEREVTGERIRDKIAASKKKGMWMGGDPPLGYHASERTLVINLAEAKPVRHLFALYLQLGCVCRVKDEVDRLGLKTKRSTTTNGAERGSKPFSRGHIYRLLSNLIYTWSDCAQGSALPRPASSADRG
jgi:TPR repeat protein